MKEHPLLFSGTMVRALLDGSKTQTRRVVDWKRLHKQAGLPFPTKCCLAWFTILKGWGIDAGDDVMREVSCPYGQVGDQLWVRETWAAPHKFDGMPPRCIPEGTRITFRADSGPSGLMWRPSIFLMAWMARLTLEITYIRVQRVQEISDNDCFAEGIQVRSERGLTSAYRDYEREEKHFNSYPYFCPASSYRSLWDSINAKRGLDWQSNHWVWVISFKKVGDEGTPVARKASTNL